MRWGDVDLVFKTWRIPQADFKTGRATTLPLTDRAVELLHSRRTPESGDAAKFVFLAKSASGHIEGVKEAWDRVVKRAGLQDFRPHDLRHTAASWLVASGASLPITGGALGHRDQKSTQRYAHLGVLSDQRCAGEGPHGYSGSRQVSSGSLETLVRHDWRLVTEQLPDGVSDPRPDR